MDIFFTILVTTFLYWILVVTIKNKTKFTGAFIPWTIFIVHHLMTLGYFAFTANSSSDSYKYYRVSSKSDTWLNLYDTGTQFVSFLCWPFSHGIGLSYYATMYLFSFFGLIGVFLFYMAGKEQIKSHPIVFLGIGFLDVAFILPNLHFWTSSLGKGSLMTLGLGLTFWGLSKFNKRYIQLFIGLFLTFSIRPHIFISVVVSILVGFVFTSAVIKNYIKLGVIFISLVLIYFTNDVVTEYANVDSLNILDESSTSDLHHRVESLQRAKSGVDINNYSLPMKLFTFWFRPLFIDSSGLFSMLSSIENVFYLFMFYTVIRYGIKYWSLWNGWFKICIFQFLFSSVALAQITGNLGLAMRQKSQLMPLLFIVFCLAISYSRKYNTQQRVKNL